MDIKLTEFSHGAGCGCKLSPGVLSDIIGKTAAPAFERLLVGNDKRDDAAVVDLDGKTAIISTTDFFMPIVDDPFDFGGIAATNAISDIYAMGGEPIVAIAILGWPIDKIPASVAGQVLLGAREACNRAGIPLAGGHSIDAPEPIFGLAVTGKAPVERIKKNEDGKAGDLLYLTKPLGIGLVTTAQKRKIADAEDLAVARQSMLQLNDAGMELAALPGVHALTDVTGFGLGGHLLEVCEASGTSALLRPADIPVFPFAGKYIALKCLPGGTQRNWQTYGAHFHLANPGDFAILADPQTSGGLLLSVSPGARHDVEAFLKDRGLPHRPIGELREADGRIGISVA